MQKDYYKILGISRNASVQEIKDAYTKKLSKLYQERLEGIDVEDDILDLNEAYDILSDSKRRKYYDDHTSLFKKGELAKTRGTRVASISENEEEVAKKGNSALFKLGIAALATMIIAGSGFIGYKIGHNKANQPATETYANNNAKSNNDTKTVTANTSKKSNNEKSVTDSVSNDSEINNQETTVREDVVDYGSVEDDSLVTSRAQALAEQLEIANVINPDTGARYSADEIKTLIKYANGVYAPQSLEEIDILHLNLLNLLISQLNTEDYLYHVAYASGNDDFKDLVSDNINNVGFAESFAAYGNNGVYPLIEWIQNKRFEIFNTTDRDKINSIYTEVGQVMADLMKGNGATITLNKETYTFTSEQILAHPSSAMLLTIEAQLIFANHYELRDVNDNIIESAKTEFEVYNKLNRDSEGMIPDTVSLDEIQAWINNGCDYEWGIDDVLINGQTFGQRIQGDMEGMAKNNYYMYNDTKSLSK